MLIPEFEVGEGGNRSVDFNAISMLDVWERDRFLTNDPEADPVAEVGHRVHLGVEFFT